MDFHNRRNIRKADHDYSKSCIYFITINIRFGQCLFGKAISPSEMELNELGKMAQKFWIEIPVHFSHVKLGEFVIMPNHMHGIIHVGEMGNDDMLQSHLTEVGPQHVVTEKAPVYNQFGPLPSGSLSVIIGQYKSAVTRWANHNKFGGLFSWHSRFYDRIISDKESLIAAQYYIRQNPEKWWQKYKDSVW